MPPEATFATRPLGSWLSRIPHAWRIPLLRLALAAAVLLAWFARDWADMAGQWWGSSTYSHILLVPPILAWLVWLRARQLAMLIPEAWWPGLLLVAGALFLWLLGDVSGLNLARQLGAVMVLQGAIVTLTGPRVTAGLLFPLGYMLFLVPFGDVMVPTLQLITAKLSVTFIHWAGVPATISGVFITTPAGLFEVAEACSGVKFLVAMTALAVLVAQICFRSWPRRIAFLAFSVVLPVVANGVRAWGTIYIAQFQGVEFAKGFDHIFYGWIFFALVMGILLGIAWRFFDRAPDDPGIDARAIEALPLLLRLGRWRTGGWTAFAAVAALVSLTGAWSARAMSLSAQLPVRIELPQVAGWQHAPYRPELWWEPRAGGADRRLLGSYRDAEGHDVDVFFALYSSQEEGRDAGAFGEGALMPDTDWRWLEPGPPVAQAKSDLLFARGRIHRLAVTFYRTGHLLTGSNPKLKLANMRDRLLMRAEPTMMLILSAEDHPGHPAAESIAAFRKAAGPTGAWMDAIAQTK